MALRNTHKTFGSVAKFFHWLIAILVIGMLCVGASLSYIPSGATKTLIIQAHKSTGVTVLILMILSLLWRQINPHPVFPNTMKKWEKLLARWVHWLLYLAVIAMPISGIVMSYAAGYPIKLWWIYPLNLPWIPQNKTLATFANSAHGYIAVTIVALVILHTLGALKHLFISKDGIFQRMWPGGNKPRNFFR